MVCAYAVSLFVTHWLFVVVKPKLLTLPWFARAWARFMALRDRAWRWVGAPALWRDGAPLGDKACEKFWAVTSSTQCSGKFLGLGIGGVSMKTAAHYRAMAEECIKWAGEAYTAEVRESYLQLARIWLDTASRLNGLSAGEVALEEPTTTARSAD